MRLRLLSAVLLGGIQADAATEFGGMLARQEPGELLDYLARDGSLSWLRTSGGLVDRPGILEQSYLFPAAPSHQVPDQSAFPVHRYPEDLAAVFGAAKTHAAERFPKVGAWEIGNEMEFIFSDDLPERTASATKAAYLGLRAAGFQGRILMPSLAFRPGPFARGLMDNWTHRWTDGWNAHYYGWSQDFAGNVDEHRRFLHDLGGDSLPIWFTEVGTPELNGDGTRPEPVLLDRQACFFERVAIEAWMLGVDGFGAFTFSPYVQGPQDYGMTEADRSPRPALERFLHVANTVRNARPLFELLDDRSGARVGVVIRLQDRRWWTVLWSPHRRAEDDLPPPTSHAAGPDKAPATSQHSFRVHVPAGATLGVRPDRMVSTEAAGLREMSVSAATNRHLSTPPGRYGIDGVRWKRWKSPPLPDRPPNPGSVVTQLRLPDATPDREGLCHRFEAGKPIRAEAVAYNFSAASVNGRIRIRVPDGWTARPTGNPRLEIPANSSNAVSFLLTPAKGVHPQLRYPVRVDWRQGFRTADRAATLLSPTATADTGVDRVEWSPEWSPFSPSVEWSAEPCPGGLMRLRLLKPEEGTQPGIVAALPDDFRARGSDSIHIRMRTHSGPFPAGVRVEFITRDRVVTGATRIGRITGAVKEMDFRIDDAEADFWSHADPERRWRPEEIRWVRIRFPGLSRATELDLLAIELHRVPG
jgi:hypothetical protein